MAHAWHTAFRAVTKSSGGKAGLLVKPAASDLLDAGMRYPVLVLSP
jgi:hypothetical protein